MKKLRVIALVALACSLSLPCTAAWAGTSPGNNGTIKVDGRPFDNGKDNEPHVACRLQIDYWGFDASVTGSDLSFELIPPTNDGVILTAHAVLSDGTGSKNVNLQGALLGSGVDPHPIQGWHVKVTATTPFSNGNDTKSKVFWITPCEGS